MRVLVVDQDSASNEAIARSLRDLFTVDAVTNKGDCLDLLRSNHFEVIVATERLFDGSGLELLGQVAKKRPSMLRIFAADRERLKLLKGRLGPFQLFQTLAYPIDPDRLIATLNLAEAAQSAEADTSSIQHVELTGEFSDLQTEAPAAEADDSGEPAEAEPEDSGQFPAPEPLPRLAPAEQARGESVGGRSAHRGAAQYQARSRGTATTRRSSGPGTPTPRFVPNLSASRGAASPSSRSFGGAAPMRHRSKRAGTRAAVPPPDVDRTSPFERYPSIEPPRTDSFAEAAEIARSAGTNFESSTGELDTNRLVLMMGGGAAAVLLLVVLGFRFFGSKAEAPRPALAPVVRAPQYPQEVTDLIAKVESSLQADDFKAARLAVDQLHALAPSHPRLPFFEALLAQRADAVSKVSASTSGHGKRSPRRIAGSGGTAGDAAASGSGSPTVGAGSGAASGSSWTRGSGAGDGLTHEARGSGAGDGLTREARGSGGGDGSTSEARVSGVGSASASGTAGGAAEAGIGMGSASRTAATGGVGSSRGPAGSSADASQLSSGSQDGSATGAPHGGSADEPNLSPETPSGVTLHTPPAGTSALTSMRAPNPTLPEHASAASAEPNGLSSPVQQAVPVLAAAASANSSAPSSASTSSTPASSPRRSTSDEPPPVVREAKLIRRVEPDYPSAAKHDGVIGSVDLDVTVSPSGAVTDVTVVQAAPPDMFEKSALAALRKWKYDPRYVDGLPSEAHLRVHLDFGPGK